MSITYKAGALVRTFKVPLATLTFFIIAEVALFGLGLFWRLPYKNSYNSSHEGQKLQMIQELDAVPDLVVLGSSWAEYGIDVSLLSSRLGLRAVNLAVISSNLYEQSLIYKRVRERFGKAPRYTILLLDYTHVPVRRRAEVTQLLARPSDIARESGYFSRDFLESLIRSRIKLLRYRYDIEIALRGLVTKDPDYFPKEISIHDENIEIWQRERRWEKPFELPVDSSLHRRFDNSDILDLVAFLEGSFTGTTLIVADGPIALEVASNFPAIFSYGIAGHPWIHYFDWRKDLDLNLQCDFYDYDHLNAEGAERFSMWIADKMRGGGIGI